MWVRTEIYSVEANREVAEAEIYEKVIISGHWENDNLSCMADAAYGEMLAELEAE